MMPLVDAVFTTWPRPCSISNGRNTSLLRTMPSTLTSSSAPPLLGRDLLGPAGDHRAHVVHHDVDAAERRRDTGARAATKSSAAVTSSAASDRDAALGRDLARPPSRPELRRRR